MSPEKGTSSTFITSSAAESRMSGRVQDRSDMKRSRGRSHHGEEITFANILPPVFICVIISTIWSIYYGLHLMPLLQVTLPGHLRNQEDVNRGCFELVVSQALVVLLLVCYVRAVLTAPGAVPSDPVWKLGACGVTSQMIVPVTQEVKNTGERRHCKWCLKYKPDRCHHCRVCNCCVLKMDHHCPWIMNCVGFGNHKYFFLLVVYTVAACAFIACTLLGQVRRSCAQEMPGMNRFLLVLAMVFASIMGTLMLAFLAFHTYLMISGMTTIEFCEKSTLLRAGAPGKRAVYDCGFLGNLQAVLGQRPLLWLLPVCPPGGDGLSFPPTRCAAATDAGVDPEWTCHRSPATAEC